VAEPSRADEWELARYQEGDEAGLLELFVTVFGKSRSLEHWTWQFKRNPYGGPFVSMARRKRDRAVVGGYSVMPVMLNFLGRAVPACQSVDTAVHPDFRGQRIFEKTATDCYAWCADAGLQAVVGFPNASSYPGFVRSLGWKRIVFPTAHALRLGLGNVLRKMGAIGWLGAPFDGVYRLGMRLRLAGRLATARRRAGAASFQVATSVPAGYEALWNRWKLQEVLSVWKDSKYFAWRYDENPDHAFSYFYLARDAGIPALAVGVEIDSALILCELIVGDRDVATGRLLVAEICRYALERGLSTVRFLGHDAGLFGDVLEDFERQRSYTNVFGGRMLAPGPVGEELPHADRWTVTFGDGDFV
jgi:hypothetical protein